ncbi:MAG: hypothetical protein HC827_19930 [Cyanobacteria bacterium RM1_2_2]|nr:hypothetical protein [Cyanobacteria bacterium RM1_2_2]
MRGNAGVLKPVISTQPSPTPQPNLAQPNIIGISLMLILPAVMVLAVVGYRKQRARVLQQQIKLLNRIWQLDSSKKLS